LHEVSEREAVRTLDPDAGIEPVEDAAGCLVDRLRDGVGLDPLTIDPLLHDLARLRVRAGGSSICRVDCLAYRHGQSTSRSARSTGSTRPMVMGDPRRSNPGAP